MKTVEKHRRSVRRARYRMDDFKYIIGAIVSMALILAVMFALVSRVDVDEEPIAEEETIDPHEGQVYLYDGFDWVWMTPLEGVKVNEFTENDFMSIDGKIEYIGGQFETMRGIDVSEHQKVIDWEKVAASGIDFAYIRVGRRGYTEGGLFDDEYFEANIDAAEKNGLIVGVYMFSQAITPEEAVEEANFLIGKVKEHEIVLPVVYDWEKIYDTEARTAEVTMETRTDCAVAFCETVKEAGYDPCVYFNRNLGYYGYDLTKLTDYTFWFSLPESGFPNFYYDVNIWQYSFTESIPGIEVETDANLWFIPRVEQDSTVA